MLFTHTKSLPRGIKEFQLGKTLKHLRELFDPKWWGEYKIELNRNGGVACFVLRYPLQPRMPFRVISAECPAFDECEVLDEASAFRLSFFYRREVKQELGEEGLIEQAVKHYGRSPNLLPKDYEGFYRTCRWEDQKTRIDLGLGHQYDRLRFVDLASADWFSAVRLREQKANSFGDLF